MLDNFFMILSSFFYFLKRDVTIDILVIDISGWDVSGAIKRLRGEIPHPDEITSLHLIPSVAKIIKPLPL
jgi:hypothetical protein